MVWKEGREVLFYHAPFLWAHLFFPCSSSLCLQRYEWILKFLPYCDCPLELSFDKAFLKMVFCFLSRPQRCQQWKSTTELLSLFTVISLDFWTTSILANWMAPGNVSRDGNSIACPVKWLLLRFWPQPAGSLPNVSRTQFGNQRRPGTLPRGQFGCAHPVWQAGIV